jgi:hypothetical protein
MFLNLFLRRDADPRSYYILWRMFSTDKRRIEKFLEMFPPARRQKELAKGMPASSFPGQGINNQYY